MGLLHTEQLCARAPRCGRAPTGPTRVVGPLVAGSVLQVLAVVLALALNAPAGWVVASWVVSAIGAVIIERRALGSLLAGAGMRVARPYEPGEQVRVFVPSLDRVVDAEVVRVGPANTTLLTGAGLVMVPNTRMLRG